MRRWSKVLSVAGYLLFTGMVAYAWGVVASFAQRRSDHEFLFKRQSRFVYELASKQAYTELALLNIVDLQEMKALDRKYGKIRSWSVERVHVRELGLPGYVEVRVERDKAQIELVSFMGRGYATVGVPWMNYESDIFGRN